METIGALFSAIVEGMQQTFNIYGYDISLWQIYVFTIVAGIISVLIGGIFNG